jgi:hypothetical protein
MIDAILFVIIIFVFFGFNRGAIMSGQRKPVKSEIIFTVSLLTLIAAGIIFKYYIPGFVWFYPAAWAVIMILFNWLESEMSLEIVLYEVLLEAVLLSFFMMPFSKFTSYFFAGSFFIFMLLTAAGYKILMLRKSFWPGLAFMLAGVFTVKIVVLEYLPSWISLPVALLVAIFLCVRKADTLEFYLEEKNIIKLMMFLYPLFVIQCLFIALLKNPVFGG